MNEQSSQTPLPSLGWDLLARGQQENDSISRCPGGHIHLDYGNLTIRFHGGDFLTFARMVVEAAARLRGISPNLADHPLAFGSSKFFSLN